MSYQGFDFYSSEIVSEIQASPYLGDGVVYDYAATQFSSYPAVVVTASNLTGEFADTSRVKDEFKFSVLIMANRLNNEKLIETSMRQLVDDIIQRLQNNSVINSNTSTFLKPVSVQWGYAKAPDPDMRAAHLTVSIVVGQ